MPDETVTVMSREAARAINDATKKALDEVAERFGLNVSVAGGSYNSTDGTLKPKVTFSMADTARRQYDAYAVMFGLKPEWFGQPFTVGLRRFTVSGIRPKAPKRAVLARGGDGKEYCLSAVAVIAAFGEQGQ